MNSYLIYCAYLHRFYKRYKDGAPEIMTLLLSSVFLTLNLFTIYDTLSYFLIEKMPFSSALVYIIAGIISLINYLIVFKPKRYQDVDIPKKFGLKVIAYLVISLILLIGIATLHRNRDLKIRESSQNIESKR
jgi:hypothetical protein